MGPAAVPASGVGSLEFAELPPLGLYVHLPWCIRKCPYCDFNSYEARGALPEFEYVEAVLRDLRDARADAQGRAVTSIFMGGGTPSLFSGDAVRRLLTGIRATVDVAADVEVTLEANPGAVDAARFAQFRVAGVNRLSVGFQSLRAAQLRVLGRVHDGADAREALRTARSAGFDNINVDLMYALPGDEVTGSMGDLEGVLELAPAHVSWYQLTLEPNTAFERSPPKLPDEDVVAAIEEHGRALLGSAGFERYEISAYATSGRRCRHNVNYWSFGDYLGVGAGAHAKVTLPQQRCFERQARTRNPRTYMLGPKATRESVGSPRQAATEFLLNALRLVQGVEVATFATRAGQPASAIATARAQAVARGWLVDDADRLRATPSGLERLNRLLELFV